MIHKECPKVHYYVEHDFLNFYADPLAAKIIVNDPLRDEINIYKKI